MNAGQEKRMGDLSERIRSAVTSTVEFEKSRREKRKNK
jgi:hypothetical protein